MMNRWKIRGRELALDHPRLMAILNLTPDSFSDGGRWLRPEDAIQAARRFVAEGADILDLGAESTRPGAPAVTETEELQRLLPVLETLRSECTLPISIDTTKPGVAQRCLEAGADIINDVSGLQTGGDEMARVVAHYGAGLVLMHRRGDAATMQSLTQYSDLVADVKKELKISIEQALAAGVEPAAIVVDPGLGFAKTAEQSLELLRRVEEFRALGYPMLVGPSRKSFIGKITGREAPEARVWGTAAAVAWAAFHHAAVFRVHDVAAMRDVLIMIHSLQGEGKEHVRAF